MFASIRRPTIAGYHEYPRRPRHGRTRSDPPVCRLVRATGISGLGRSRAPRSARVLAHSRAGLDRPPQRREHRRRDQNLFAGKLRKSATPCQGLGTSCRLEAASRVCRSAGSRMATTFAIAGGGRASGPAGCPRQYGRRRRRPSTISIALVDHRSGRPPSALAPYSADPADLLIGPVENAADRRSDRGRAIRCPAPRPGGSQCDRSRFPQSARRCGPVRGTARSRSGIIAFALCGGVKESCTGREGAKYGIVEFLEIKYLYLGAAGQRPANSSVAGPPAARSRYQRPLLPRTERTKTSSPSVTTQITTALAGCASVRITTSGTSRKARRVSASNFAIAVLRLASASYSSTGRGEEAAPFRVPEQGRPAAAGRAGSARRAGPGRSAGGQRRRRALLPQAFDAGEAGLLQHLRMPRETAGDVEQIVIEKQGAGLQHPGDLAVAGGDRLEIAQIVNRDRRYGEIERSADARAPLRVAEIGEDVTDPLGVRRKPAARLGEHRLRIVLQRHPRGRKGAQYLLRDDPVAAADIEDRDRGLGRESGMREHLPEMLSAFGVAPLIACDPPRHITLRVPVVFADRKALLRRRHVALPPGVGGQD